MLPFLALLGLAVSDLLRWSPDAVAPRRALLAAAGATAVTFAAGALGGLSGLDLLLAGAAVAVVVLVWQLAAAPPLSRLAPGWSLAWIAAALAGVLVASGAGPGASGPLRDWYADLGFGFTRSVPLEQFLLGLAAALFLLSTANRIVRLVLEAAGTPVARNETTLRGGRLLGPMERLVVLAMVLAREPTGAAIIIAAKGLLRLPEIRDAAAERRGDADQVTEYLLVGTFASLLLAGAVAALVLGAG